MKSKASITLSSDLLEMVDQLAGEQSSRSEIIERAVRAYIQQVVRMKRDRRDLEILNRTAKRMRGEAKDALRYQVKL